MNFSEILTQAWKITWKHKVLWIFGILASLGQGGGGGSSNSRVDGSNYTDLPTEWTHTFTQASNYLSQVDWWIWMLVAIVFIVLCFVLYGLSTLGEVGLITGTQQAEKIEGKLQFNTVFRMSQPYFWRIFAFNLLAGLAIALMIVLLVAPLVGLGILTDGIALIFMIPLACVVILPGSIILGIVMRQAVIAMVTENLGMLPGLARAWLVVRKNPGPVAVMAIILAVGGGIVGFIIAIPAVLAVTPIMVPLFTGSTDMLVQAILVSVALICAYSPILLLASGILTAFTSVAWVLTYLRLSRPAADQTPAVAVLSETPPGI